ncbi:MAG: flagellar hook-basal body complex protein FliE [Methylococcaceae bacterium]|nr:flagellar hook-basal body complex protein FliE [Methylococcaceae bacterium]MCI0734203.1 flagellar hook-basal body complex protein FliE [Methylococcaceae bacterium]
MSSMDVNQVLAQMRELAAQAGGAARSSTNPGNFADLLKNSIEKVNETQQHANHMATAFETADTDASLSDVMISIQKANVSFQAMVQVRNKLVEAYKDVMNMPM